MIRLTANPAQALRLPMYFEHANGGAYAHANSGITPGGEISALGDKLVQYPTHGHGLQVYPVTGNIDRLADACNETNVLFWRVP